jgi:hypothetical protein
MWLMSAESDHVNVRSAKSTSRSIQLLQHSGGVSPRANDEWATRVEGPRCARTHHHTLRVHPASGVYLRVSPIQFVFTRAPCVRGAFLSNQPVGSALCGTSSHRPENANRFESKWLRSASWDAFSRSHCLLRSRVSFACTWLAGGAGGRGLWEELTGNQRFEEPIRTKPVDSHT